MKAGKQKQIKYDEAVPQIVEMLGNDNLDKYVLKDQFGQIDED
jgi:hypothetical protein